MKLVLGLLDAVAFSLSFAFLGATLGIGCYFLHPAQYRSTARIYVTDRPAAASLRTAILSAPTASAAILAADLYHRERKSHPLAEVLSKLPVECIVIPTGARGVMVDLAVTYGDAQMARKAVDTILRVVLPNSGQTLHPWAGFAAPPPGAGPAVRISGFESGAAGLLGAMIGLLIHSVLIQFRYTAHLEKDSPAPNRIKLKFLVR